MGFWGERYFNGVAGFLGWKLHPDLSYEVFDINREAENAPFHGGEDTSYCGNDIFLSHRTVQMAI